MAGDEIIASVYHKIEREKALIAAATNMRQSTDNKSTQQRIDGEIREGRRNIAYLESKLRELQSRKDGDALSGPPQLPPLGAADEQRGGLDAPTPPPKDSRSGYMGDTGDYGDPGPGGYSQGGTGLMPSRAPFADPQPNPAIPKARPNYGKLGM